MLPDKVKLLDVAIAGQPRGQLLRQSRYEFRYLAADPAQPSVGLLMPPEQMTYEDGVPAPASPACSPRSSTSSPMASALASRTSPR